MSNMRISQSWQCTPCLKFLSFYNCFFWQLSGLSTRYIFSPAQYKALGQVGIMDLFQSVSLRVTFFLHNLLYLLLSFCLLYIQGYASQFLLKTQIQAIEEGLTWPYVEVNPQEHLTIYKDEMNPPLLSECSTVLYYDTLYYIYAMGLLKEL